MEKNSYPIPFEIPPGLKLFDTLNEESMGPLTSISLSPDGRTLASSSSDQNIQLIDTQTGELQTTLCGHTGSVFCIAWSPDGNTLASGSSDKTIRLWDPNSGKQRLTLQGHSDFVISMDWSPDGCILASGSRDKTIRMWNPKTGELDKIIQAHTHYVRSVAWAPNGQILASSSSDGVICLWNPETGEMEALMQGHSGTVHCVAWSPDGNTLASGSHDKTIRLWDSKTGQKQQIMLGHTDAVLSLAWSPDGCGLFSGSSDMTLRLWNPKTGALQKTLKSCENSVRKIIWPHDRYIVFGLANRTIRIWNMFDEEVKTLAQGNIRCVTSIAWSADGDTLAAGFDDNSIGIWDIYNRKWQMTLSGHTGYVYSVAWSPDGRILASGSRDNTIRLWDMKTGQLQTILLGHTGYVYSVAFSPDSHFLASGSLDNTVRLWNMENRKLDKILEGHANAIRSVAWSPDGHFLASGSYDGAIRVWNMKDGEPQTLLQDHTTSVLRIAWAPDGYILASASSDNTIRLWDIKSQQMIRILEGHTDYIYAISFSFDGRLLGSSSKNEECIWDITTCRLTLNLKYRKTIQHFGCSTFHPQKLIWAILDDFNIKIYLWELDLSLILKNHQSIGYTTAKIVLVGDSGVGKTGLGWRLAHGKFKEQISTHGQQFWILDQLHTQRADGTECEAVLWDLAGQPDYRLIHALFLDDADLALVLFDPTERQEPLHGVAYWLRSLCNNKERPCRIILVGARTDRGDATLSEKEITDFCSEQKISGGYTATSAVTGEGLDKLMVRIKEQILWDEMTAISTSTIFKQIKKYVLSLKESTEQKAETLATQNELYLHLQNMNPDSQFNEDDIRIAVRHLSKQGYVHVLRTANGIETILLQPELLNNLAASFILEARRNPEGLGALEEDRVLRGEYLFPELKSLTPEEQNIMLDAATILFIEHNICFRELLGPTKFLVFPALINQKKPRIENEVKIEDDVSYTIIGAVENVYAALVVLLGYTQVFRRTDHWQKQAQYEVNAGEICGFRQEFEEEGAFDLVLYYGINVNESNRLLFQGLIESFLIKHQLGIIKYPALQCPKCNYHQDRVTIVRRIKDKISFLYCTNCSKKILIPKAAEIKSLPKPSQQIVTREQVRAFVRTKFEEDLLWLKNYRRALGKDTTEPKCFLSYAWGVPEHEKWIEHQLARDLQKAGLGVILDRWQNAHISANIARFISLIKESDYIIVVGSILYQKKYENMNSPQGSIAAAEMDLANQRLTGPEALKETVLPILLEGTKEQSLPPLLQGRVYADFRKEEDYFATLFDLILTIYQIPFESQAVADLRDSLRSERWRIGEVQK